MSNTTYTAALSALTSERDSLTAEQQRITTRLQHLERAIASLEPLTETEVAAVRAAVAAATQAKPSTPSKREERRATPSKTGSPFFRVVSDEQILDAIRGGGGSVMPGPLAVTLQIARESLRPRIAALVSRGLVTISGTTNTRRITLVASAGPVAAAETKTPTAETTARADETPVDGTTFAQAVDAAVQARLRQGRATLAQLEAALPKDLAATLRRHGQDVTATLKKSLRRLTLRRQIADVGEHFTLLAGAA